MRKIFLSSMAILAMLACSTNDVTGPTTTTQQEETASAVAPAPVAAVPEATAGTYDVKWLDNAGWALTNTTGTMLYYTAQYTNFDDQSKVLGSKDLNAAPGTTSEGTFDKTCVQVDLVSGKIFAHAFFNEKGKVSKPENLGGCKAKPCVNVPTTRTVETIVGETCSRYKVVTEYTLNSCTKEETSKELSRTKIEDNVRTYTAQLKLTADANSPNRGDSFFKYHIFKQKSGLDTQIWEDNLAKGEVVYVDVPNDGAKYYAFYDGEILNTTPKVTATCGDTKATWHPTLGLVCEEHNSCGI